MHINDLHSECIRICLSVLNKNSIDLLNKTKLNSSSNKLFSYLKEFDNYIKKNKLDKELIALDESMVLSAYSLRDAKDIGFLLHSSVSSKVKLKSSSHIAIHNEYVSRFYKKKLDDIIMDPRNYFYFKGLKFVSLSLLFEMKESRKYIKDIIDIELIKNILEPSLNYYLILKIKEFIFYRILRLRTLIIRILIKFKFYLILKKLFKLIFNDRFN